jgi:hypothetical protein
MTADEETVWAEHFQRLQRLLASGQPRDRQRIVRVLV